MNYQIAFSPSFELGFNLNQYPFLTDKSYRNDMSPSFWFKDGNDYLVLWVDFPEKSMREEQKSKRYTVVTAINHDSDDCPDIDSSNGDVIFESESSRELSLFLKRFES